MEGTASKLLQHSRLHAGSILSSVPMCDLNVRSEERKREGRKIVFQRVLMADE
jgi:hypothetical protein